MVQQVNKQKKAEMDKQSRPKCCFEEKRPECGPNRRIIRQMGIELATNSKEEGGFQRARLPLGIKTAHLLKALCTRAAFTVSGPAQVDTLLHGSITGQCFSRARSIQTQS